MTLKELLRKLQEVPPDDGWTLQISLEQDGMEIELDVEIVEMYPYTKTVLIGMREIV